MKYYQLSELDIKELGINPDLLLGRELLGYIDNTRTDVEVGLGKRLNDEEWASLKETYKTSDEADDVSTAINIFLQNTYFLKEQNNK